MTNVTGMSFSVSASTNYHVHCQLLAQTVTAGTGQFEWTGPASPTAVQYGAAGQTGINTFGVGITLVTSTSLTEVNVGLGLINGANSGTVQMLMANGTTGDGVTIKAGSFCIVQ
jgi:hypothetical protein